MSRFDDLIAARTRTRRLAADAAAARILAVLQGRGIDIRLFGSLARGDFMAHSDVDFLVRGPVDSAIRIAVETTVARELTAPDLPYDIIIYLDDLTDEQAAAFAHA